MSGLIKRRGSAFFRSQTLAAIYSKLQRSNCTLAEGVMEKCSVIDEDISSVDTSKWKKVRAIDCGIRNSMVPESSLNVLRLLRRQGFDAYLVGGCVRDLILHRPPKDYDVITTANLKQIRRLFHRAQVVGRRFPICHVWMKGSVIEVSSFNTVAQNDTEHENDTRDTKEKINLFKMYSGWDAKDCNLWRNSLQRDFTVNSLFFDPFELKIYDYNNGMEDLKDLKLRTLVPAHVSFSEDCARVLRGLRLSARLGLSLSKDIKTALPESISSIANLSPVRIFMEMNYMLGYGAAAPSILLLMKYKLLHVLLPFQAAYLEQATKTSQQSSLMLMKLFSNMDKLVSCKQPADSRLWIALLAFHITLVRNPQEAIVLHAFASLLYHRNWREALRFARENENSVAGYVPEVSKKSSRKRSDEDLAEAVSEFASLLRDTQYVLTDMESLHEALYHFPSFTRSGLVFVSKNKGKQLADLFTGMSDVESYESEKHGFSIDYCSLGKGVTCEVGFVLGKIILDTIIEQPTPVEKKQSAIDQIVPSACMEEKKEAELVISKEDNKGLGQIHDSKASSVFKAHQKILKRMRENSEHKNEQESEVCPDSTLSGQAKNQDQSVVQKPKRLRPHKEALVPEAPKQKASKRSKSDEQESLACPAKNQHQTVDQKNNKGGTKPLVSDPPKQKSRLKETQKVKHNDIPVREIQDAKLGFVSDKSMSDLLKVLVKPSQQASSKEESYSLPSSEKTKKPRKLSSLFR
ncbi:unnamed protein product [Brassica rapa]|uniref:Poly A polymerase head domain-containing protein n=1 Tax=Brassica campestris TaxID=3711 RepID=A0A3P5Z1G8_BRACM|nr:unnamed protein product [Brassica rapa]VDC67773.1 unnamed protein product [Brassica rapa]